MQRGRFPAGAADRGGKLRSRRFQNVIARSGGREAEASVFGGADAVNRAAIPRLEEDSGAVKRGALRISDAAFEDTLSLKAREG